MKIWQADRVGTISYEHIRDNDGLTLSPPMDANTRAMVMEGFQWFIENKPENSFGSPDGAQQFPHSLNHEISIAPNNSVVARPAVPVLDGESSILEGDLATVNGPLRPVRINGRLAWSVSAIRALLNGEAK